MTRIHPATPATSDEGKALEARIIETRGEISALYRILLNSPPVADGWERLLTAIRQKTSLTPRLRELIILRVAVLNRAQYEFDAHVRHASKAGVSASEMEAITHSDLAIFSPVESLALRYTEAMTRDVRVSDELFAEIMTEFDPMMRVDLTATIAAYNMVSRFLVALDVR